MRSGKGFPVQGGGGEAVQYCVGGGGDLRKRKLGGVLVQKPVPGHLGRGHWVEKAPTPGIQELGNSKETSIKGTFRGGREPEQWRNLHPGKS